jgi:hypothetical protein
MPARLNLSEAAFKICYGKFRLKSNKPVFTGNNSETGQTPQKAASEITT